MDSDDWSLMRNRWQLWMDTRKAVRLSLVARAPFWPWLWWVVTGR